MKKLILTLILATLCGISVFAYHFSAVCSSGQTLYYNITSSSSPYQVEVTYQTYPHYNFNTDQYSNSSYSSLSGILTIPSTVTYSGRTYSVTSIGEVAFASCSGLTSVIIPNSVSSIGRVAFDCCSGLASVTIGSGVTSIGDEAFLNCSGLTSVTIPNSVTSIGSYAFYGCSGLTTVNFNATNCTSMGSNVWSDCYSLSILNIGENVTNIPANAFSGCSGLTAVYYAGTIEQWCGITFPSYPFPAHNLYINSSLVTNLVIPNTVEEIKAYAFYNANSLTSVTIPNSITSIEGAAFSNCSGLTTVNYNATNCTSMGNSVWSGCTLLSTLNIGENVTNIPDYAFSNCSGLTTVNYNATNCTSMGNSVWSGCTLLSTLNIGENVTNIPDYAFSNCSGLTSVTIPNSVTSIGASAFYNCSGVTSVTVGSGVSAIFQNAFSGCSGLTRVVYTGSIAQWCGIRFDNQSAQPLNYAHNLYVNNSLVTNLVIPNTVEEIKAYAFYNANSLTSVTIPNSVTSIGCGAFYGCSGLSGTLTIPNSVTSIGNYAFGGCSGLTTLNFNAENCSNGSNSIGFTTLTKITIGENVATIPNYAFSGCTSLDSIISYANNPPVIYGGTFDSQLSLNTPVVVPCGMVETYEDADFWYNFRRIQQRPDCGATYTITVLSSNNAWGSVSGGGTYMAGETASLIASANEGYRFSNWSDGSTENPHNITVTQNETYIATFVVGSSLPTIYSSFSAEACGSYTWNNQTYTESGEYQQTFTAANSADSVVTLTLTILPAPQPTITLYGELDACNPSSVALVTGQYQSYLWSNGATTIATSVIEPGYYYVEVTGENGCTGISEQTNVGVSNAITEAPQISVVGMNGMNRNVVTWSAMANDNVTAYRIYRENNIANVYEPMATVVASAQTYWTDETADPSSRAFRYKVTAVDECGGESPMSDYHKTMHLTINKGIGNTWNLIWSHYEGFGFGTYRVYRGTSPSNMTMIGEVPSNLNSYTDNTATASTGFYYQVEVVRNTRDAEISSRSNIVTTEGNGIEENVTMEIALFPNPTTDILNITSSETISEIEIVNVMGQVVRRIEVNGDNAVCNVEDLKSGVYVVRIRTLRQAQGAVISQRKFVKE